MAELVIQPSLTDLENRLTVVTWNYEEVKKLVAEKAEEYANIAYTDEQETLLKKDRASLNKFVVSIEDFRKKVKKIYLMPYEKIEQQAKEVLAPMRETIKLMDTQLEAIDQQRRAEKRKDIDVIFRDKAFPDFVELDMIWDEKWLLKSRSLGQISTDLEDKLNQVRNELSTIEAMPEQEVALEYYRRTLDLTEAIRKAKEHADIQKLKEEAEKARMEAEKAAAAQEASPLDGEAPPILSDWKQEPDAAVPVPAPEQRVERRISVTFRVTASQSQFGALNKVINQLREIVGTGNVEFLERRDV